MESSDKFDDFMKALGVGMIKRKLANSVVPINEVRNCCNGNVSARESNQHFLSGGDF